MGRLVLSGPIASSGAAVYLLATAMVATVPVSLATAGFARLLGAFQLALEPRGDAVRRVTGGYAAHSVSPAAVAQVAVADRAIAVPHSLPDGRAIPGVAVGRFGTLIGLSTPEDDAAPGTGPWEMDVEGEWTPFREHRPGRGRSAGMHLIPPTPDEGAFGVKVYAAVVTAGWEIDSRASCAVLRPDEILPYLTGGPSDRTAASYGSGQA